MKLFLVVAMLLLPVAGWGGGKAAPPTGLEFIIKGVSAENGSIVGARATSKKCAYYWYLGDGPRESVIIKDGKAITLHIENGKSEMNTFEFNDGDVIDEDGVRYVEGSILHGLFVTSVSHCNKNR